jgi:hypothetical protein
MFNSKNLPLCQMTEVKREARTNSMPKQIRKTTKYSRV